jgi:hypothetical protein
LPDDEIVMIELADLVDLKKVDWKESFRDRGGVWTTHPNLYLFLHPRHELLVTANEKP